MDKPMLRDKAVKALGDCLKTKNKDEAIKCAVDALADYSNFTSNQVIGKIDALTSLVGKEIDQNKQGFAEMTKEMSKRFAKVDTDINTFHTEFTTFVDTTQENFFHLMPKHTE